MAALLYESMKNQFKDDENVELVEILKLYPHVDIEIWFARESRWTLATLKRPILDCV